MVGCCNFICIAQTSLIPSHEEYLDGGDSLQSAPHVGHQEPKQEVSHQSVGYH
jgi:hypothetical protein